MLKKYLVLSFLLFMAFAGYFAVLSAQHQQIIKQNADVTNNFTNLTPDERRIAGIDADGKYTTAVALRILMNSPDRYKVLTSQGLIEDPQAVEAQYALMKPPAIQPAIQAQPALGNTVSSCGEINAPGTYTLSKDISGSGTCLNIHNTSNITLDCAGHAVDAQLNGNSNPEVITVLSVNGFTIMNCKIATMSPVFPATKYPAQPIDFLLSSNGTFKNNTVGGGGSGMFIGGSNSNIQITNNTINTLLNIQQSNHITISGNTISIVNNPNYAGGFVSFIVQLANSSAISVNNNTINGNWDGIYHPGGVAAQIGADDDILLFSETGGDIITNNTLLNVWDTGIESTGLLQNTTIANNSIKNAYVSGIGGWWNNGQLNNIIKGNTVDNAGVMFQYNYFYDTAFGPAPLVIYFENNLFAGNKFTHPNGTSSTSSNFDMEPSGSQVKFDTNTLDNNDFGFTSLLSPLIIPSSMIIDKMNNICTPPLPTPSPQNPLHCILPPGLTITPKPTSPPTLGVTPTTAVSVVFCPHGIGKCGDNANPNSIGTTTPQHATKSASLTLLDANNRPFYTAYGSATYDQSAENFQWTTGVVASGMYLVQVKAYGLLPKQLPGIVSITAGQPVTLPAISLVTGDINNDNQLDLLDYNILIGCFGSKQTTASCTNPPTAQSPGADINDDGKVDGADYNLFLRELSVQKGG